MKAHLNINHLPTIDHSFIHPTIHPSIMPCSKTDAVLTCLKIRREFHQAMLTHSEEQLPIDIKEIRDIIRRIDTKLENEEYYEAPAKSGLLRDLDCEIEKQLELKEMGEEKPLGKLLRQKEKIQEEPDEGQWHVWDALVDGGGDSDASKIAYQCRESPWPSYLFVTY